MRFETVITVTMLEQAREAFQQTDDEKLTNIAKIDDKADIINAAINEYTK